MPNTPEQRRQLRLQCELVVPGFAWQSAAQDFRQLADWCEVVGKCGLLPPQLR